MKPLHVALIAPLEVARDLYRARLAELGATCEIFPDLESFIRDGVQLDISGIIIDFRGFFGASAAARQNFLGMDTTLPVMQIRYNPSTQDISGTFDGRFLAGAEVIDAFLQNKCAPTQARRLRRSHRHTVHVPLTLLEESTNFPRAAATLNLSHEGMFVVLAEQLPAREATVRLVLRDLPENPLTLKVRWVVPWGVTTRHLPGFGAEFIAYSDAQQRFVQSLL
jgi:hypothetical protein